MFIVVGAGNSEDRASIRSDRDLLSRFALDRPREVMSSLPPHSDEVLYNVSISYVEGTTFSLSMWETVAPSGCSHH